MSSEDFAARTITVAKSESGKSRSFPMEWGGVVDALKSVQSRAISGRYVFPDRDGEPMGSIKTAFIKARAKAGISTRCRFGDDHKRRALREAAARWQKIVTNEKVALRAGSVIA